MSQVTLYHAIHGVKKIPAIDFTPAWRTAGWQTSPVPPQPPKIQSTAALRLINAAQSPDDLTPLPTVGKGAGKLIFEHRPEDGYESLAALPTAIFEMPYRCSLEDIQQYQG